jgi:hypothetical protein
MRRSCLHASDPTTCSCPAFGCSILRSAGSGIPFDLYEKIIDMLTVILLLAGFACFALFFKSIDFFDKI